MSRATELIESMIHEGRHMDKLLSMWVRKKKITAGESNDIQTKINHWEPRTLGDVADLLADILGRSRVPPMPEIKKLANAYVKDDRDVQRGYDPEVDSYFSRR